MQFSLFRSHFLYFLFFLCLFLGIPSCLGKPINRKRKLKSDNEAGKERIKWTAVQINWKIRDYWTRLRSFLRFFLCVWWIFDNVSPPTLQMVYACVSLYRCGDRVRSQAGLALAGVLLVSITIAAGKIQQYNKKMFTIVHSCTNTLCDSSVHIRSKNEEHNNCKSCKNLPYGS